MPRRASHLMLIFLVVAALHFSLVAWYQNVVMANGVAERTLRQFDAKRDRVRVVALGDSHVKWGIAADVIPGGFNFALPGETYALSFYRLQSLLDEEGLALRFIILAADPHSLEPKRGPDQPFLHYYAGFADLYAIGRAEGTPLFGWVDGLRGRFAPYVAQRSNVLAFLATGEPPEARWLASVPMQAGSLSSDAMMMRFSAAGRRAKAEERVGFHFGTTPSIDATLAEYLDRILSLCDTRGVRALLVRFPLSGEYLRALNAKVDLSRVDTRIQGSVARFGSAELLDARRAFAGAPELFADVDHLNREGARRLSRLIARRMAH